MTLERLIVRLGEAAGRPGVAFVALTRATHPDGLALDEFPAMAVFQRQRRTKSFKQRQDFERLARVKFSRTIRKHMRDATIDTSEKVWTDTEAACAQYIVTLLRSQPDIEPDHVFEHYCASQPATAHAVTAMHSSQSPSLTLWKSLRNLFSVTVLA